MLLPLPWALRYIHEQDSTPGPQTTFNHSNLNLAESAERTLVTLVKEGGSGPEHWVLTGHAKAIPDCDGKKTGTGFPSMLVGS